MPRPRKSIPELQELEPNQAHLEQVAWRVSAAKALGRERRSRLFRLRPRLPQSYGSSAMPGSNHVSGASRVTVLADEADGRIVGYVTLSAAQIERACLPKAQQRNRPDLKSPRRCSVNSRLTAVTKGGGMRGRCSSLLCGRRFKRRR